MKKYICKKCGKQFDNHSALGGHQRIHSEKLNDIREKMSKLKTLEIIEVDKICQKCGNTFTVQRKIRKDGSYAKSQEGSNYCSRSCANSRIVSEETKRKISKSLKDNIPWNKDKIYKISKSLKDNISQNKVKILKIHKKRFCKNCNKKISNNNKSGLCNICVRKTENFKNKASENLLKQYKNGKKVYGGNTKWLRYKTFKVQGTYELRTCIILDKMLKLGEINNWEYTNDRIKYIGEDNKEHNYLLDFKVDNYYIETKGYVVNKDLLKWNAAKEQGLIIKKWFLEDIEKEEKRLNLVRLV